MSEFVFRSAAEARLPCVAAYTVKGVASFPSPHGRPQVLEQVFDTLGYREIRVFAQVTIERHEVTPLAIGSASLTWSFYHSTGLSSSLYGQTKASAAVTRCVDLVATQKVFGASTRVVLSADHLPPGPYTVDVTCYLLP